MWGKTVLLVVLIVSWGLAGAAKQPKLKKVALVSMPGQGTQVIKRDVYLDLLDELLAHSGEKLAWRLVTYMPMGKKRQAKKQQNKLSALIEKGKKAYRYLNFKAAKENFSEAASLLRRLPYSGCEAEKIAQMYLYWARAVLDEGDDLAAQKILRQIFRFNPKAAPDPAVMPPNLVALFDLAMNEYQTSPKGRIVLKVEPSAASVYVDCRLQSAGLIELTGVVGDELWLHAQLSSNQLVNRLSIRQLPARELTIFSPQPGDDRLLGKRKRSIAKSKVRMLGLIGQADEGLDALATQLGVDAFVLYDWPKGQNRLSLALYVIHHGLFGQPVSISLSQAAHPTKAQLQSAVKTLADMLTGKQPQQKTLVGFSTPTPGPVPQQASKSPTNAQTLALATPDTTDKTQAQQAATAGLERDSTQDATTTLPLITEVPWYNTWWFWTASSIVLAGALTTGLVLGLDSDSGPSGKVILTVNPP